MTEKKMSAVGSDCQLATLVQQESWDRELASKQKRREALVLHGWSLSAHFRALCHRFKLRAIEDGETPDFVLTGKGRVAVEVTRIVSPRKAIYDDSVITRRAHTPQRCGVQNPVANFTALLRPAVRQTGAKLVLTLSHLPI